MQLKSGTLLQGGKYKIIRHLGQGGFGITYLAEHTSLGKRVCIKEFFMKELNLRSEDGSITGLSEGTLSYNYAKKFRKEAMNLAGMEHPNIVHVEDAFEENGTFYYVMYYVEGQNLNNYLKNHTFTESEAISIIKDVANALMYMHEQKHMLHLDLKPGNIMRRASDGHIFLIDFGLSKHYDKNGTPETSTTIGGGTPGYAPTEQGDKAKDGEFRPTIDIYALGATLFKLLTREAPPTASEVVNDDEILAERLSSKGISQSVIDLVVKAMMPGYKKRYQCVSEFLSALTSNNVTSNSYSEIPEHEETIVIPSTSASLVKPSVSDETVVMETNLINNNGHEYVDLGLSVKWAKCNVGAKSEYDCGLIFPFAKYDNPNYLPANISGDFQYDHCRKRWGGDWRMPTKEEQDELRQRCTWEYIDSGNYYKVTGPNGQFIYLPTTETKSSFAGNLRIGCYWSGNLHVSNRQTAYYLFMDISRNIISWMNDSISKEFAIRGVIE